jgi:hypothetical protein
MGVRTAVFDLATLKALSHQRILTSTLVNDFPSPHILEPTGIVRIGDIQFIGKDSSRQYSAIVVL